MGTILPDHTILFRDAFGLTRVSARGQVKTIDKVCAYPPQPLGVSVRARRVFTLGPYTYKAKVLSVDTLTTAAPLASCPAGMLDDGERVVSHAGWITSLGSGAEEGLPSALELPVRGTVEAGGEQPGAASVLAPVVGHGRLLLRAYEGPQSWLSLYQSEDGLQPLCRIGLRCTTAQIVAPFIVSGGVVVVVWSPLAGTATVHRFDLSGALLGTASVAMLGLPAVDEDRLVYQSDPDGVVVRTLSSGEEVRHDITALTAAARARSKQPLALSSAGIGHPIAGSGRLAFVPYHAESILDITEGVELSRKLPAKNAALRAAVTRWLHDNRAAMLEHGLIQLISIDIKPDRFSPTFWAGLSRAAPRSRQSQAWVASFGTAVEAACGVRQGSYGSQG